MNQYGSGQSAGTNPLGHDGRGTNAGTNTGFGTQNTSNVWPSPAAPPHAYRSDLAGVDQYGNPRREGVVDKLKDAVGMGPNSGTTGYDARRDQPGYGTTGYDARRDQPGYGTAGYDNYGQPRQEGMVDKMKDAVGMGPNSGTTGYDARRDQPGYGTAGYDNYGQPRQEGMVDKMKDAVGMGPNSGTTGHDVRRDQPGYGTTGYDARRDQPGYGTGGYDNYGQPRQEGMVDKLKDAVGMGPNSGTTGHDVRRDQPGYGTTGYDARRDQPGYGTGGYDNYGQPRQEGMVDKMKDAVGMGPNSGTTGYDARRDQPGYGTAGYDNYGQPRKEGIVDKMKDAVGMGPHSGTRGPHTGEDYTHVNRPGVGTGFGGGLGHPIGTTTGYDQSGLGSGLGTHHHDGVHVVPGNIPVVGMGEHRVEPGYDASRGQFGHHHQGTVTAGPRKEGIVEKIKDAVGMGKHDNVAHTYPGTTTGSVLPNTYGTGQAGLGPHQNTSTPGTYSHNSMVDTGLGHERHPGSSTGYPHETVGERVKDAVGVPHQDASGYPHNSTTAAYPGSTTGYHDETMGDRAKDAVRMGPHHGVTGMDYDNERRRTGFEDSPGLMHDTKTGPGFDGTNVGHSTTGTGYDDTNVDYSHNDSAAYGADGAPPKKGMMTKLKEKLHH